MMNRTHYILTMINNLQAFAGKENEEERRNFVMKQVRNLFNRIASSKPVRAVAGTVATAALTLFTFQNATQAQNLNTNLVVGPPSSGNDCDMGDGPGEQVLITAQTDAVFNPNSNHIYVVQEPCLATKKVSPDGNNIVTNYDTPRFMDIHLNEPGESTYNMFVLRDNSTRTFREMNANGHNVGVANAMTGAIGGFNSPNGIFALVNGGIYDNDTEEEVVAPMGLIRVEYDPNGAGGRYGYGINPGGDVVKIDTETGEGIPLSLGYDSEAWGAATDFAVLPDGRFVVSTADGYIVESTDEEEFVAWGTTSEPLGRISPCVSDGQSGVLVFNTNNNGYYFVAEPLPLPAELIHFNAQIVSDEPTGKSGNVKLTWHTVSEQNNSGYEIQRSKDGTGWERIGFVAGSGTTDELTQYEHLDSKPFLGLNYYRLKQIDYDGAYEFSHIEVVNTTGTANRIEIYPNPATATINITGADTGELKITNSLGEVVSSAAFSNTEFDISALPPGVYFITISTRDQLVTRRMVRQ